jgi:hypothetical protein
MIYVVYINNKGFIDTFDKTKNTYKTTTNIEDAYFSRKAERVKSVADFFGGVVLSF